jgi:hypothetical protein
MGRCDFTEADDDYETVWDLFCQIDSDRDGWISTEELHQAVSRLRAVQQDHELADALEDMLARRAEGPVGRTAGIRFEEFADGFGQLNRMKGERVRWARTLKLDGVVARVLKRGTVFDGLRGLKALRGPALEAHVQAVCRAVAAALPDILRGAVRELQRTGATVGARAVEEHMNSKFVMDGAFVGRFATLDDFYRGPEQLIGVPNPKVDEGAEKEHTLRPNCKKRFTSNNYNLTTWPALEWEFVVNPKEEEGLYPHTPRDKRKWLEADDWKGEHGRDVIRLEDLMAMPAVKRQVEQAGLIRVEVISLRLYTGPMFVLYNAALRGFPEKDVECLAGDGGAINKYETTIFCIASGITKLSKVPPSTPPAPQAWPTCKP